MGSNPIPFARNKTQTGRSSAVSGILTAVRGRDNADDADTREGRDDTIVLPGGGLVPLIMSCVAGLGAAGYGFWSGLGLFAAFGIYVIVGVAAFLVTAIGLFVWITLRTRNRQSD